MSPIISRIASTGIINSTSGFNVSRRRGGSSSLYSFTSHTFTNASAEGTIGPTLTQCTTAYSSASWTQNSSYFNMNSNDGIQLWTVPATGTYRLTVAGAQGGSGKWTSYYGGRGRIMVATMALTQAQILQIIVGQRGGYIDNSGQGSSGGGGGSFVFLGSGTRDLTSILVAAGGGSGGGGNSSPSNGNDGVTTTTGGSNASAVAGGSSGNGGGANGGGGSGAGIISNGGNGANTAAGGIAISGTARGGRGGSCTASQTQTNGSRNFGSLGQDQGGFGGGGGGEWCSQGGVGGGGGYSGGAGNSTSTGVGGGGGSFVGNGSTLVSNTGLNGTTTAGSIFNNSHGYVTIDFLG